MQRQKTPLPTIVLYSDVTIYSKDRTRVVLYTKYPWHPVLYKRL